MAARAGLRLWKTLYHILGRTPTCVLTLRVAPGSDGLMKSDLKTLIIGTFGTFVSLDAGASLRFMKVIQGLVRRSAPMITSSHGVEMPEIGSISKHEI
jgi:hypothetical protein